MSHEWLDIVDDAGNPVGRATRADAHASGLWHRTVHVWVIVSGGETGALLFQQRSATKDVAPGLLDVSVGGHCAPGEDAREAACRELEEELGIRARPDRLRSLGLRQTSGVYGDVLDREFQTIFGIEDARPLSGYRVQPDEVSGLALVPVGLGISVLGGETSRLAVPYAAVRGDGTTSVGRRQVAASDFLPAEDGYFRRALAMAGRWLGGDDHGVI